MKIVVTGTRGVPNIMGGVETHCEELFPRVAKRGFDVTIIRRSNYVQDDLKEWNGVKLVTIPSPKKKSFEAIIHTFRAINRAKKIGADVLAHSCYWSSLARSLCQVVGYEGGVYASWS